MNRERFYILSLHITQKENWASNPREGEVMANTKNLNYNSNDIEIRNDATMVLKPKRYHYWYSYDEEKDETKYLRKFYKLELSFRRTINSSFKVTNEIHVRIDGDDDIRESPSIHINEIHNIKDLRKLISEALFRVSRFDVGEIPPSLRRDKRLNGYKYLTVSITDPDACASLFSDEWLAEVLHWVEALKERES